MTVRLSPAQRMHVSRHVRSRSASGAAAGESDGELNLVPFLDMVMNIMLFVLATIAVVATSRIDVPARHVGPGTTVVVPTVTITARGYVVGLSTGFLQPDCEHTGAAAATVLALGDTGVLDASALTRCLAHARTSPSLRGSGLDSGTVLDIAAGGAIAYGELVRTLDAVRESRPGARDLYPDARLGTMR